MRLRYKTNKLEKSFTTDKGLFRHYGALAKKIKMRRQQLESADNLWVIAQLPVLRLHQHQGDGKGSWTIDIHQNWRIRFEVAQDPIPYLEDGGVDLKAITIICIDAVLDPH